MYRDQTELAFQPGPGDRPSDVAVSLSPQVDLFPTTRFMGSKERLLGPLWRNISRLRPARVLDLCSGTGVVSYMLKAQGCEVHANDFMRMASTIARALVVNDAVRLTAADIGQVAGAAPVAGTASRLYGDLYYDAADMGFIDAARPIIRSFDDDRRALAMAALIRACIKRRPRGIFTFTGQRYDDGRRDLRLTLREHFVASCAVINAAVFGNGRRHQATAYDFARAYPDCQPDVVYLDPPYFSPLSDNEYVRRYHFTEALARDWVDVDIQHETKTKKMRNYPSPFTTEAGAAAAFAAVAERYRDAALVISYSTNSRPTADDIMALLRRCRRDVRVEAVDHKYSFGTQGNVRQPRRNDVKELIFTAV